VGRILDPFDHSLFLMEKEVCVFVVFFKPGGEEKKKRRKKKITFYNAIHL